MSSNRRVPLIVVLALLLLGPLGPVACGLGQERGDEAASPSVPGLDRAVDPTGEVQDRTIVVAGTERRYRLYVPSTLPDGPVPLFLALHGGMGWGEQFARNDGVEGLAEANGFLVAHPTGTPVGAGPGAVWNGGSCCGPAARNDVDDVTFLTAVIADVAGSHAVDPTRTYAFGHSNGGIMAYRLACEAGDLVVGIGAVGASLGIDDCAPAAPVSLIAVHGTADTHHPIEGGVGPDSLAQVDFRSAADSVAALVAADGCGDGPSRHRDGDLDVEDWASCADGSAVRFVTITGASHAWPGGDGRSFSGEPYAGYDATEEIVAFLLAHPRR